MFYIIKSYIFKFKKKQDIQLRVLEEDIKILQNIIQSFFEKKKIKIMQNNASSFLAPSFLHYSLPPLTQIKQHHNQFICVPPLEMCHGK